MAVKQHGELSNSSHNSCRKESHNPNRIPSAILPVLCCDAAQSNDQNDVGRKGIPRVTVEYCQICTHKNSNLERQNAKRHSRCNVLTDCRVGPVRDYYCQVQKCCYCRPCGIYSNSVKNEHAHKPDIYLPVLFDQDIRIRIKISVHNNQTNVQCQRYEEQKRKGSLQNLPIPDHHPTGVKAHVTKISQTEWNGHNGRMSVHRTIVGTSEEIYQCIHDPGNLPDVDERPNCKRPASRGDLNVIFVGYLSCSVLEDSWKQTDIQQFVLTKKKWYIFPIYGNNTSFTGSSFRQAHWNLVNNSYIYFENKIFAFIFFHGIKVIEVFLFRMKMIFPRNE